MRRALFALSLMPLAGVALAAETGTTQTFGDWLVGCDNTRSCTAIGLSPEAAGVFAYLKVAREGGPGSRASISVSILDELAAGGPIRLELEGGTLDRETWEVEENASSFATAQAGERSRAAIEALLPGETLQVSIGEETAPISLGGMSAALRYMDAAQERAGTALALVAKGERPEDTVPAAPLPGSIPSMRLTEIDTPAQRPQGLPERDEFCPESAGDTVLQAENGTLLWGVCSSSGAYNLFSDFSIVVDGIATAADLGPQGTGIDPDGGDTGSTLVNAALAEDGRTLQAFFRGRGLGDCGSITSWVFDGRAMRLVEESGMGECRGVRPDDWPVTYRAEIDNQ